MNKEEEEYVQKLESTILQSSQNQPNYNNYASALMSGTPKQNLVEWQLDFRPDMLDIERFLRNDIKTYDKDGNEVWLRNKVDLIFFNDCGVNDILRIVRMILNKNTVLSNYREEQLHFRMRWFGHELRKLIYNNAEMYGFDNEYKWNNYSMIVFVVMSMVESAYRRAINGEERRDLNQARIVNQNDPVVPNNINVFSGMQQQKKTKWYNPFTWGK